jgi:transcriptional regulator with XRE-family HTH domain
MNERTVFEISEGRRGVRNGAGRALRLAAGLTQAEIAAAVGVSAACISRWESGSRTPRGGAAARYGRLLDRLRREAIGA